MNKRDKEDHSSTGLESANSLYTVFMLLMSALAILFLGVGTVAQLDPNSSTILDYADNMICCIFMLDFAISLYRAPNRLSYFLSWGWIDLLSSIPAVDFLRIGRLARILRILRVLRGIKATKILADFVLKRRSQSTCLAAAIVVVLLVIVSSIAVLQFETSPEANIKTPQDALWWAIVTITTVGYGDRFPLSTEGRVVASFLMLAGVGLFGILSGFVASWFVQPTQQEQESEIRMLLAEVKSLRRLVESRCPIKEEVGTCDDTEPHDNL